MKRLFLFLLISSCYLSYSQTIDILLYNYGSTPVVSQPLIIQAYESAGYNVVNLDYTNIDTSLNVNNYDVLIVHEGYVYVSNLDQWVADPLSETKRVLIENFVINGGHVVWVSESNQSVFPNKSNITINNIYGTNLQNGPFYALIYGPSGMNRIHPSNGPGGLSSQEIIFASGSYSTILNVHNCNKLYNVSNNQAYTPTQEQYYTLTIENNGCIGKDSVYVSFKETPELTLSITSDSICRGDQVFINVSSQNPLTSIQWENGIVNNQAFRPDSSTTYIARATLSNSSTKDSIDLFVGEYPIVNTIDDFTLCKEGLISLYAETSEDAIISWSDGIENGIPFLINESSVYYVSANLNNCISQESVMIELISNVKANFDYTLEPYSNSELKGIFKNYSSQGDSIEYYWEFINDLNTSTNFEPNYIFNNDREFVDVSLLVSNQYGCKDSIVKTIQIYLLYIPNTFTPNYDQTNDLFKPILSLLPREYEFIIYTRWGEQIFKTNDYKDGWDGIYNGNLVGDGVYTLKLLINNKAYTQSFTVMSAN